jgi:hypothetical protein
MYHTEQWRQSYKINSALENFVALKLQRTIKSDRFWNQLFVNGKWFLPAKCSHRTCIPKTANYVHSSATTLYDNASILVSRIILLFSRRFGKKLESFVSFYSRDEATISSLFDATSSPASTLLFLSIHVHPPASISKVHN